MRKVIKFLLVALLFIVARALYGQEPPEVPSKVAPPATSSCGPKWLGGCYVAPDRSWRSSLADPYWWAPTAGLVLSKVFDAEATHAKVSHSCVEGNSDYGTPFPSRGQLYAHAWHEGIVVGMGLLITKATPEHPRKWPGKVAKWIYPAMASYGIQQHVRGGYGWLHDCS